MLQHVLIQSNQYRGVYQQASNVDNGKLEQLRAQVTLAGLWKGPQSIPCEVAQHGGAKGEDVGHCQLDLPWAHGHIPCLRKPDRFKYELQDVQHSKIDHRADGAHDGEFNKSFYPLGIVHKALPGPSH